MTYKQIIIDRVNVKECKYYCNGKCERYEEFVEADYANYSVKCICEKENDLGTYDICDYQQLKAKEQECETLEEMLKDKTDEYNKLAVNYDAYISVANKQLDQLKKANDEKNELLAKLGCPTIATARMKAFTLEQQLEAYKMEAEEGKEINAELKAENDDLKKYKDVIDKLAGMQVILTNENGVPQLYDNAKDLKLKQLSKALAEIKEIAEEYRISNSYYTPLARKILQKISECEVE